MDRIDATARVEDGARIGSATTLWQYAHVRAGARIGDECTVGRGVYVGPGAVVGDRCKIQNYALVYEPARLGNGVFVGPAAVLTNDQFPRAINVDGTLKNNEDWEQVGVVIDDGASIGARAVCIAPVKIGAWATVPAGAVVTRDVPPYAVVAGVPARRRGWVGEAGRPLRSDGDGTWTCPATGRRYVESGDDLEPV